MACGESMGALLARFGGVSVHLAFACIEELQRCVSSGVVHSYACFVYSRALDC